MVMSNEDFKRGIKFIRQRGYEIRQKRKRAATLFLNLLERGLNVDEARGTVRLDEELSDRQLDHILDMSVMLPPGYATDMTIRMQKLCDRADEDAQMIAAQADTMLAGIDALEELGQEWYEKRNEVGLISKGVIDKTERIPLQRARQEILDWRADRIKRYADILKAFKSDVTVNNNFLGQMSDEELAKVEKSEEIKLRGRRDEKSHGGSAGGVTGNPVNSTSK
jgi:hypothetical protein